MWPVYRKIGPRIESPLVVCDIFQREMNQNMLKEKKDWRDHTSAKQLIPEEVSEQNL